MDIEDEILFDAPWIQVKKTSSGYYYSHLPKANGRGVAVLGYMEEDGETMYLGRYEECPANHLGIQLTALAGGLEPGYTSVAIAKKELLEEGGYDAEEREFEYMGSIRPIKSSDTIVELFCIDLSGKEMGIPEGDGSLHEKGSYAKWIELKEMVGCEDPINHALIMRFLYS